MSELIVVAGGPSEAPGPQADTEAKLRQVLQSIDPLLDVKWIPHAMWNAVKARWEGRYALSVAWPQADKRWSQVQSGEVAPQMAYDIVGWMCTDMEKASSYPESLEGIEERVMALLGSMDNTRYPWKQRMLQVIAANKKHQQSIKQEALDFTESEAEYWYRYAKNVPQSTGADFNSKGELIQ